MNPSVGVNDVDIGASIMQKSINQTEGKSFIDSRKYSVNKSQNSGIKQFEPRNNFESVQVCKGTRNSPIASR